MAMDLSLCLLACTLVLLPSVPAVKGDGCDVRGLAIEDGQYLFRPRTSAPLRPVPPSTYPLPVTIPVGASVSVCCNDSFYLKGPETVTCISDGHLSEETPACEDLDECALVWQYVDTGEEFYSFSSSFHAAGGAIAMEPAPTEPPLAVPLEQQISCQGREVVPPPEQLCHPDAICRNTRGAFSCECPYDYVGDGFNCRVDDDPCDSPTPLANGSYHQSTERHVSYSCDEGFILYGCSERSCRAGIWEPTECGDASCQLRSFIQCDELRAPENGHIDGLGEVRIGSRVYFYCDEGFDLVGSSERQCLSMDYDPTRGRWSGRSARCRPKKTLLDIVKDFKRDLVDKLTLYTNSSTSSLARSGNVNRPGLDLVLAFDRSSSIREDDFQLVINFTKQLIGSFGVSNEPAGTRVAAVTFSTTATVQFNLTGDVDTPEEVYAHLDTLKDGLGGGTGLKEGLETVAVSLQPYMRPLTKHVLFIFTDGQHNTEDPGALADNLKGNGVEIYAVGVGALINKTALQTIASYPPTSHFFFIKTFDDLNALTELISSNEVDYSPCGEAGDNFQEGDALKNNAYRAGEKVWPWLSIIYRATPTGREMMCVGTLLCRDWVLTSASCLDVSFDHYVIDGHLFENGVDEAITITVTLGEHNTTFEGGLEQTITVDRIVMHDDYVVGNYDFDLALMHLSEQIEPNPSVRTACLPSNIDVLRNCHVIGWASSGDAEGSSVPIQFPLPRARLSTCQELHTDDATITVNENIVCAGERFGQDTRCQGDRGSPLMCERDDGTGTWVVLGVSALAAGCSEWDQYGLFTKTGPEYRAWIQAQTGNCTVQQV